MRVGIDVGGTFTDFLLAPDEGDPEVFKVLSTPEDPSIGVMTGLTQMADASNRDLDAFLSDLSLIVHGTTVTTNATLTRQGARTALLTTKGVVDALEMRRGIREEQYNNQFQNVAPIVPRYLRAGVPGRLAWDGSEVEPVDLEFIEGLVAGWKKEDITSVAICMMNSFANPSHEHAARDALQKAWGENPPFFSVSSDVLPSIRFYPRVSTTALDAFTGPILQNYLSSLIVRLKDGGFDGTLLVMQSGGGVVDAQIASDHPVTTLLSGPAAGPEAGLFFARKLGFEDCVTADMGGTSFDVSLVEGGVPVVTTEGEIDRLRIGLPMLDIVTIGAGGGSIAWVDSGGLLRVGPQSAGSAPGPACYGKGGDSFTSTDADLLLGYLDPAAFAAGTMPLDRAASEAAAGPLAERLGLSVPEAAAGVYRVINTAMASGVREVTVRRGIDPRQLPLIIAGGAGPLHGAAIAEELDIPLVIIPNYGPILCASGMLMSSLEHEFVRSHPRLLRSLEVNEVNRLIAEMKARGAELLSSESIGPENQSHQVILDLRYRRQYHEIRTAVDSTALETGDWSAIEDVFHEEHDRRFGYELRNEGTPVEVINIRIKSIGTVAGLELKAQARSAEDVPVLRRTSATFPGVGSREVSVFDGDRLQLGHRIEGPALVESRNTTIVVPPAFVLFVDPYGSVVLVNRHHPDTIAKVERILDGGSA